MPSGRTHAKIWLYGAPVAIAIAAHNVMTSPTPAAAAGIIAGYTLGRWIDPDLDQFGITSAEWRAVRELRFLGVLIAMYFMPYAYLVPHRSFISHAPVIGTAIRLVYMAAPWIALAILLQWIPPDWFISGTVGLFAGLALSDGFHWAADVLIKER